MATRKITVSTSGYEISHGRKPSPSLRGLWMFLLADGCDEQVRLGGEYRAAVREAKRLAAEKGARTVHVMP